MPNRDRLTGLDTSFLHLEDDGRSHMHVAGLYVFKGRIPPYDDLVEHLVSRLDLVPRYRQRLADVPFGQGRPVWVDDPHFNARYHVRHTALPAPGGDDQLKRLVGRLMSQQLDRTKPLWEMWLVDDLRGERFAIVAKTHHALVDGISGVDITNVLFDTAPEPVPPSRAEEAWVPRPTPTGAQLLSEALLERATMPAEIVRGVRATLRTPRRVLGGARDSLQGIGALAWAGLAGAPPSPLNVAIGPHRRYDWVPADLDTFRAIKTALHGTVNDAVLSVVALALGRWLRGQGHATEGVRLRALVPVSVRGDDERGALGNRVAAFAAPLPVGVQDPAAVFAEIHEATERLKQSGQSVGAQALTDLAGFAPSTIMSQASRLMARQRFFNLVVTNVPGPQQPLYLLGHRLQEMYPVVPLAAGQALGIAILSYNGRLGFGLMSDLDALSDLDVLAADLRAAIDDLAATAGVDRPPPARARRRTAKARA
jgi:WS/DGAT/MGAT family acyltransferase